MSSIALIVAALLLAAAGVMFSRGDTGIDSRGRTVGPATPGRPAAGVPFFLAAALAAAGAAYMLLGGRWG